MEDKFIKQGELQTQKKKLSNLTQIILEYIWIEFEFP